MLMRIDYFAQKINLAWEHCLGAFKRRQGHADFETADRLFSARCDLDGSIKNLRSACHVQDEARLRDAATALVQTYAAYAPEADLGWLGFPPTWGRVAGKSIQSTIIRPRWSRENVSNSPLRHASLRVSGERLCRPDVIHGIASALSAIEVLWRKPIESEELVEWLRQENRLVMVDRRPRIAYLDGELTGLDWDNYAKLWDFLWKLARSSQRGLPVSADELAPPGERDTRKVANQKSRLCKKVPQLTDLIVDVPPGGYQLVIRPNQVAVLKLDNDDKLIEVGQDTGLPW